jgi:transposase
MKMLVSSNDVITGAHTTKVHREPKIVKFIVYDRKTLDPMPGHDLVFRDEETARLFSLLMGYIIPLDREALFV